MSISACKGNKTDLKDMDSEDADSMATTAIEDTVIQVIEEPYIIDTLEQKIIDAGLVNIQDTDISNRYTLLSGLTGGLFLFVSYFGTDQSQVQRYLGGKSLKASRIGLMFNGLMKIPMQFFILFVGIMVFISFQFNEPPIIFNASAVDVETQKNDSLRMIETEYHQVFETKKAALEEISTSSAQDFTVVKQMQSQQDSLL